MIERELLANWNSVFYPEPEPLEEETYGQEQAEEVLLAQAPSDEQPGFGNVPIGQFTRGVFDTAAAGLKGATQGFLGLPGDLEMIGRMLVNLVGGDVDEETYLATTDEIKKVLDQYAPLHTRLEPRGEEMAQNIGEFAAPGGYLKGISAATKGRKAAKVAGRTAAISGASATIKKTQQEPK